MSFWEVLTTLFLYFIFVNDKTNVWQIDSFQHIGTLIMLQVQSFEMKSFCQVLNPINE